MRRSMERLHLGRGFVLSGEVALDEVAVTGQRPNLFDGFLLGDSVLRRSLLMSLRKQGTPRNHKRVQSHDESECARNTPVNFLSGPSIFQTWQDIENQPDRLVNYLQKENRRKDNRLKQPCD